MACSMWLFRLAFRSYVALAPFVVWQSPWFANTLSDDADPMIGLTIWCCCVEFLLLVWVCLCVGVSFVIFVVVTLSLRGRIRLCMGILFVVIVVVTFVFAWLRSQMDELVSWLPKPILVLQEGGAAWGWRCSGVALLEGSSLVVYVDRQSTENCLITTKHQHNSLVIYWCLLSYAVKVINE